METPRPGERIFGPGDENLLRLAHDTGSAFLATTQAMFLTYGGLVFIGSAPVVIVFTKYDRLVMINWDELQEDDGSLSEDPLRERTLRKGEQVRTAFMNFKRCIRSLECTLRETNTPKPPHVTVSGIYFPLFIWIRVDQSPHTVKSNAAEFNVFSLANAECNAFYV